MSGNHRKKLGHLPNRYPSNFTINLGRFYQLFAFYLVGKIHLFTIETSLYSLVRALQMLLNGASFMVGGPN